MCVKDRERLSNKQRRNAESEAESMRKTIRIHPSSVHVVPPKCRGGPLTSAQHLFAKVYGSQRSPLLQLSGSILGAQLMALSEGEGVPADSNWADPLSILLKEPLRMPTFPQKP